jgi:hypothetical protein
VVQQLIEKRADLNMDCKDEQGWTAPSLAVENGHEAVMRLSALNYRTPSYAVVK